MKIEVKKLASVKSSQTTHVDLLDSKIGKSTFFPNTIIANYYICIYTDVYIHITKSYGFDISYTYNISYTYMH